MVSFLEDLIIKGVCNKLFGFLEVRMTGRVTFKVQQQREFYNAWYEVKERKMCVVDYQKTAKVFFPFLRKSVEVIYKESCSYSDGFLERVCIQTSEPIKFSVVEAGFDARKLCEKQLCKAIRKFMIQDHPYPWSGW